MKIWLDDERDPKNFRGYEDYEWYKNPFEVIRLIRQNKVTHISFDNDLGTDIEGWNVAETFELMTAHNQLENFPVWNVHSANPVAAKRINVIMTNAEKIYKGNCHDRT